MKNKNNKGTVAGVFGICVCPIIAAAIGANLGYTGSSFHPHGAQILWAGIILGFALDFYLIPKLVRGLKKS